MIIAEKKNNTQIRQEQWILTAGLLILLTIVSSIILRSGKKTMMVPRADQIVCSAEKVIGDQFVQGDHVFSKGNLQSDERSRSGDFSCKIGTGEGIQFGFGYRLSSGKPGEVFRVSAWRFKNTKNEGRLVIQNSGGRPIYKMEETPVKTEDSGWEQLSTTFVIPFGEQPDHFHIYVYASGFNEVYFDDLVIEKIGNWPENAYQVKKLNIRVGPDGLKKLKKKRETALRKGLLQTSDNDWVEALLIDSAGLEIPATLRLKGDWTDHLEGDKWSFRIKVKPPNVWHPVNGDQKGLVTFSVHTPMTRYFLSEWLVHQCWLQEGILTTRYEFTEVLLNGQSLGIYAIEEHFEKQLVESQERREGPILKFSEEGLWSGIERQLQNHGYIHYNYRSSVDKWENAPTEAFGQQRIMKDTLLSKQFASARQLMFEYKNGLKPAAEVFDLDKTARFYAIADVFNAYHGIIWHNQRFYFNPMLGRLEPIGFDAFGGKPPRRYTILGEGALNPNGKEANRLFGYLLQDKEFNKLYFKYLYHYSSRDFLGKFLEKNQQKWAERLALLQLEFPDYQPAYKSFLEDGLFVHSLILPYDNHSLKVFTQEVSDGQKMVSVQNTHHLPIEIIGYGYQRKQIDKLLDTTMILPGHLSRRYLSRLSRDSIIRDFNATKFLHDEALALQESGEIKSLTVTTNTRFIHYKLPGIDSVFSSRVLSWKRPSLPTLKNRSIASDIHDKKYQMLFLVQGNQIMFYPGKQQLSEPLILPSGYEVSFSEGTELDLVNGSYLISYSAIRVYGVEDNPVVFTSSDKTGRGVALFQTSTPSRVQYAIFDNLNTINNNEQQLTGAFSGYESDISFYNCVFRENRCEDALNLVRSTFTLQDCLFADISSDAFDADFCKGEIKGCTFSNSINDAMDFSGSIVTIADCFVTAPGDKGVSCGEASDITVLDTTIEDAPIAVASKDLSVLFLRNITIKNCRQGFVAFQKKPEFGPGKIIVESYAAENIDKLYNIAEGSFLQLGADN
jgi:hypothetical protein